jgi:type IV pilus assembly protein PilM
MWTKLQNMFAYRVDRVVGVDISPSAVKVAELDWQKGRPLLTHIGMADLAPGTVENGYCRDTDALAGAMRQAFSAAGTARRDVILGIGAPGLFVREVAYPAMSMGELAQAVKWDSERLITLAPDSYYLDFAVTGRTADGAELQVLVVASPREIVDDLVLSAKNAGLRPVAIDAEPLAVNRTLQAADNSLVVDIGTELAKVTLFQGGSPAVTRPVPIGGRRFTEVIMKVFQMDFAEAERVKQRRKELLRLGSAGGEQSTIHRQMEFVALDLVREAARTAQYYSMQNKDAVVNKVFLTGGGGALDGLDKYFADQFDVPVISHDPLTDITVSPRLDPQYVRALSCRFATAVGLALRGGGP